MPVREALSGRGSCIVITSKPATVTEIPGVGRGKCGKELGKGGARRYRKLLRNDISRITKPAVSPTRMCQCPLHVITRFPCDVAVDQLPCPDICGVCRCPWSRCPVELRTTTTADVWHWIVVNFFSHGIWATLVVTRTVPGSDLWSRQAAVLLDDYFSLYCDSNFLK